MTALEFTRRWALHVLPAGVTKTRTFGGWSNRRRASYLDRCARLLGAADVPLSDEADQFEPQNWQLREEAPCRCPSCGARLQLVLMETRRSWRDVLNSPIAPIWYRLRNPLRPSDSSG
ncbi:MAG: transposase [Pirellulaceae bacterium]|nr:transposase [Pirellulaceae bacterium]